MQQEIERKFLVLNDDFTKEEGLQEKIDIRQGYISKDFGKVVRVQHRKWKYLTFLPNNSQYLRTFTKNLLFMRKKKKNIMEKIKENEYKVVRLSATEFELENGDVYPLPFDLEEGTTIEEFQKHINDSKEIMLSLLNKFEDAE